MLLEDENLVHRLIKLLKTFGDFSELKVNKEKLMVCGSAQRDNQHVEVKKFNSC